MLKLGFNHQGYFRWTFLSLNSSKLWNSFVFWYRGLIPPFFQVCGAWSTPVFGVPCFHPALVNVTPQVMPTGTVLWCHPVPTSGDNRYLSRHTFIPRWLPGYRKNFKGSGKVKDRRSRASQARKLHFLTLKGWIGPEQPSVAPLGNSPQTERSQRPECRAIKRDFSWK